MKIYNSMTNKKEVFEPQIKGQVSMYVCGPTVYDHPHIGNARPLVVFDLMQNVLTAFGYDVHFVSNYTDIDDKIIDKAEAEGVDARLVADRYIEAYENLRTAFNNNKVETIRVTETIKDIVGYIESLIELGFAYEVDGDVYFRVDKIDDYGKLSGQVREDLLVGARIDENTNKESPLDFTLWKKTTVGERFESPWSLGRPGWHTECVVMIQKSFVQERIDIHGGGMDLKFPHHENEIAQSCASHQSDLANYWVHNGMISFDGEKMSKSEGNVILAKDLVEEYGGPYIRWFLLSAHYRAPLKFSDSMLEQSNQELNRIFHALNQAYIYFGLRGLELQKADKTDHYHEFKEALADDFNTPNAIKVMIDTSKSLNQSLRGRELDLKLVSALVLSLKAMLEIFGIDYQKPVVSNEDQDLFKMWNLKKSERDFEEADKYREALQKRGLL